MLKWSDIRAASRALSDALARMSWGRFSLLALGGIVVAAALPGWPILSWASALALPAALLCSLLKIEAGARTRAVASRDEARLAAGAAEARAQSIGARLDPHFLFNAMGAVEHLIATEPLLAIKAQQRLSVYLRSGLSSLEISTSGAQSAACEAYLELQSMRMGARISWSASWSPQLAGSPMLARAAIGLVETAVSQSIEPFVDGGAIRVSSIKDSAGRASWRIDFPAQGVEPSDIAPWRSLWMSAARSPSWVCVKDSGRWTIEMGWLPD